MSLKISISYATLEYNTKTRLRFSSSVSFSCSTRTRTQTDRTRICSATITPLSSGECPSKGHEQLMISQKRVQKYCFYLIPTNFSAKKCKITAFLVFPGTVLYTFRSLRVSNSTAIWGLGKVLVPFETTPMLRLCYR